MDASRPTPSRDMLPPFRIRQIRLPSGDAVVRMKKDEYDELLKTQPSAALRYVDESDGEVILVGSSLELDERLQEPVENVPRTHADANVHFCGVGMKPMHLFDVEKSDDVLTAWRTLDERTTTEGQKARALFFGRQQAPSPALILATATLSKEEPPRTSASSRSVRFGHPSPPRGIFDTTDKTRKNSKHANRWAAYSHMPGSFDHAPIPVSPPEPEEKELLLPSVPVAPPSSNPPTIANMHSTGTASEAITNTFSHQVRSSTLQIPSTQTQKKEHQQLLDTFWKTEPKTKPLVDDKTSSTNTDMSEKQVDKSASDPVVSAEAATQEASSTTTQTSPKPEDVSPVDSLPQPESVEVRLQTPGELLTSSIQSLLNGMGQLASAFKLTNHELQQQVSIAQRDFPNNVERAIKTSATSIDSLIRALSHVQVPQETRHVKAVRFSHNPTIAELDDQDRIQNPVEMEAAKGQNVTKPNSGSNTGAQTVGNLTEQGSATDAERARKSAREALRAQRIAHAEQYEQKVLNDRIDSTVEQMRLTLLSIGWQAPASNSRIYTRADVLEDFLAEFQKLRSKLESEKDEIIDAECSESEPSSPKAQPEETSAQPEQKKSQEHPYAWDLVFDPESEERELNKSNLQAVPRAMKEVRPSAPIYPPRTTLPVTPEAESTSRPLQTDAGRDISVTTLMDILEKAQTAEVKKLPIEPSATSSLQQVIPQDEASAPRGKPHDCHEMSTIKPKDVYQAPEYKCSKCSARFYHHDTLSRHKALKHGQHQSQNSLSTDLPTPDSFIYAAEMAVESIQAKYPPVSQLMKAPVKITSQRPVSFPAATSRTARYIPPMRPSPAAPSAEPSAAQMRLLDNADPTAQPQPTLEPKTAASGPPTLPRSTLWQSAPVFTPNADPAGRALEPVSSARTLSPQMSMPALSTAYKPSTVAERVADSRPAKPQPPRRATTNVRRSTSVADLLFRPGAVGRSNTVRRDADYPPLPPPPRRSGGDKSIESCKKQLMEMGFERSKSQLVAEAVMGNLEAAIDVLADDENARRQARTDGRGKAMPGAFDEELYG